MEKLIEPFKEPLSILEGFNDVDIQEKTEMSNFELSFLCGLIKIHKPKKY